MTKLFNDTIHSSEFPDERKLAEVTATYKNDKKIKSKNYRSVSVSPTVLKVRIMHRQMSIFVEKCLSSYMCGYRKGFSTQQASLSLIET